MRTLTPSELELLEDCLDDWRGLWELPASNPELPAREHAALVSGLIRRGLLNLLEVSSWEEARDASAAPIEAALCLAQDIGSYGAPGEEDNLFLLAITDEGETQVRIAQRELFGE